MRCSTVPKSRKRKMVLPQLSNMENLILRTRSEFNNSVGIECELCWSTGVLECWQKRKPKFYLNWSSHYSITPPLHHSCRLPQGGKSMGAPSEASGKPGPLGPDFLFLFFSNSLPPAQQPTEHTKSKIMNFCESSLLEAIGNHRRTVAR